MDLDKKAIRLILQFLDEHSYKRTLRELINESGVSFEHTESLPSGALLSLIEDFEITTTNGSRYDSTRPLLPPEDNVYANTELLALHVVSSGSPVLVSKLNEKGSFFNFDVVLVSGCANHCISVLTIKCPITSEGYLCEEPRQLNCHKAGVLTLDIHPHYQDLVASGSMDHSVIIWDISLGGGQLCCVNDHSKFVVRVKWSPSGNYLITASYDKSFILYSVDTQWLDKLESFQMDHPIEGLAFKNFSDEFIVSLRGDNYIRHFKIIESRAGEKINLNAIGDDHVSFTALDISFSPNDRLILVTTGLLAHPKTDQQHQLLLDADSCEHIGVHYGFLSDELSQPRHCWHPSGSYFYETSQDNTINVVSVNKLTVIHKLIGHTQLVRHLSFSEVHNVLVSSSFDGSVRLWKC